MHPRDDVRIFHKECKSLAEYGYQVSLIVADNGSDDTQGKVKIYDVGKERSRRHRIIKTPKKILKKALSLNCQLYHFHDPELLSIGKKLIKKGKKVIYDIHEDLPKQIRHKPYLNTFVKRLLSATIEKYEKAKSKQLSALITATDSIKERFSRFHPIVISVKNYPIQKELETTAPWAQRKNQVCYIGSLSKTRGIIEILSSATNTRAKLLIAGAFSDEGIEQEALQHPGWNSVIYKGFVDRAEIRKILQESKIGLVTLHPTPGYMEALPVKMFEYMLGGIPVIASDIPLWRKIVEETSCGIVVDPYNPNDIANAIEKILNDDDQAEQMGKNGQKAIAETYNWENEKIKLFELYESLL